MQPSKFENRSDVQVTAVDNEHNLFLIQNVMPDHLVKQVLDTDWLNIPWQKQDGQELWPRRRIDNKSLPWNQEWDTYCKDLWPRLAILLGHTITAYSGTAWWLDEPGFTCALHTDGELPGSMHLTWIGAHDSLGTTFYWYKDLTSVRYQFPMECNSGYIMINQINSDQYRRLLWHGMLNPVPSNTFRLTSYSWINFDNYIST